MMAALGQLRTHAPQSTAQNAHGRLESEVGACDAMALTIATDISRGGYYVLMRAAKAKRVSFLRGGENDTCVVFDIRPSPRAICTKAWRREHAKRVRNTTHVSFLPPMTGTNHGPIGFGYATLVEAEEQ